MIATVERVRRLPYANILQASVRVYAAGLDLKDPRASPLYADFTKGFPPTLHDARTDVLYQPLEFRQLQDDFPGCGAQSVNRFVWQNE